MRKPSEQAIEEPKPTRRRAPAKSLEGRENQLIAMAYDEAELAMRNHTATSQMLTELMRRGSTKERLEKQLLEQRIALDAAKIEDIKNRANLENLAADAIAAMKKYNGSTDRDD